MRVRAWRNCKEKFEGFTAEERGMLRAMGATIHTVNIFMVETDEHYKLMVNPTYTLQLIDE